MIKPEEVAKEIKRIAFRLSHEYGDRKDWFYKCVDPSIIQSIKLDRSRLIQYIREKMPKNRPYEDRMCDEPDCFPEGWNSCIEAVEKLLEGMK